ncbi:hypothetical protein ABBQ32_004580 [Trebouxia sp. C0010 RCD-2024]
MQELQASETWGQAVAAVQLEQPQVPVLHAVLGLELEAAEGQEAGEVHNVDQPERGRNLEMLVEKKG